jgi:hypothetical protein
MVYDIYHDESKEEAYWHGFYFVPRKNRNCLLNLLYEARKNVNYFHQIHYCKIKSKVKSNSAKAIITKSWTSIGVASLQQQKPDQNPLKIYMGQIPRRDPEYKILKDLITCKFAVFKEKDKHKKMFFKYDKLRNIEITFKMALKGALHRLFDNENPITVGNVYIDNDEQYKGQYGRNINKSNIIRQLQLEKRTYVKFLDNSKIIPQKSDHFKINSKQDPADSHLLQLCDILIGGVRFYSYCPDPASAKYRISEQCKYLLEHDQENKAWMNNSRYCNGFLLNKAWIENNKWIFNQTNVAKDNKHKQLNLQFK